MRKVRGLPLAPRDLDLLSALPLESLLGDAGSPLAGGGGGSDSDGSKESAGGSSYGPADSGADVATGSEDFFGGNENPSNANNDTAPPVKKAKHRE